MAKYANACSAEHVQNSVALFIAGSAPHASVASCRHLWTAYGHVRTVLCFLSLSLLTPELIVSFSLPLLPWETQMTSCFCLSWIQQFPEIETSFKSI